MFDPSAPAGDGAFSGAAGLAAINKQHQITKNTNPKRIKTLEVEISRRIKPSFASVSAARTLSLLPEMRSKRLPHETRSKTSKGIGRRGRGFTRERKKRQRRRRRAEAERVPASGGGGGGDGGGGGGEEGGSRSHGRRWRELNPRELTLYGSAERGVWRGGRGRGIS